MAQAGEAVIDRQEGTVAGESRDDLGAPLSLSAIGCSRADALGLGCLSHQQAAQCIYLCIACYYYPEFLKWVECCSAW